MRSEVQILSPRLLSHRKSRQGSPSRPLAGFEVGRWIYCWVILPSDLGGRTPKSLGPTLTTGRSSAWLERTVRVREVGGSNPLAPTCLEVKSRRQSRWRQPAGFAVCRPHWLASQTRTTVHRNQTIPAPLTSWTCLRGASGKIRTRAELAVAPTLVLPHANRVARSTRPSVLRLGGCII